jgi:hypothetical protein
MFDRFLTLNSGNAKSESSNTGAKVFLFLNFALDFRNQEQ